MESGEGVVGSTHAAHRRTIIRDDRVLPSVVATLMAIDRRRSAIRITLQSQVIGLGLMLLAVVRAWGDFDHSSGLTWVFVGGIGGMFASLLALDIAMGSRYRANHRSGDVPARHVTPGPA